MYKPIDVYRYDRYTRYLVDELETKLGMKLEYKCIGDCDSAYPNIKIVNEFDVLRLSEWKFRDEIKNLSFSYDLVADNPIKIPKNVVSITNGSEIKFKVHMENQLQYYAGCDNHNLLLKCPLKYYECDDFDIENCEDNDNYNGLEILVCELYSVEALPRNLKALTVTQAETSPKSIPPKLMSVSMYQDQEVKESLDGILELHTDDNLKQRYLALKTLYLSEPIEEKIESPIVIPDGVEVAFIDNVSTCDIRDVVRAPKSIKCLVLNHVDENVIVDGPEDTCIDYLVIVYCKEAEINFEINVKVKVVYFIGCNADIDQFKYPEIIEKIYSHNSMLTGFEDKDVCGKPEADSVYAVMDTEINMGDE